MRKDRLRTEITVTLVVKFLLIGLLWFAFFRQPLDERLTADGVGDSVLGASKTQAYSHSKYKESQRW